MYLGCSDMYFGCLDLYFWMSGHAFWVGLWEFAVLFQRKEGRYESTGQADRLGTECSACYNFCEDGALPELYCLLRCLLKSAELWHQQLFVHTPPSLQL